MYNILMLTCVIILFIFIFILGAVMGSFVGAMTWRMHQGLDWVRGRSECEHCHHQLSALDLIPLASYISLRGKCRYCHKPIGRTAIALEISTGLAFLGSALLWPSVILGQWVSPANLLSLTPMATLLLGIWLVCLTIMVALFNYDLKWRLLPNKLVFPLIVASLVYSMVYYLGVRQVGVGEWLMNLGLGLLPITGVYGVLYVLSKGEWIGLGDVKLGIALGWLVPWWGGVVVLFLSNLLGSLVALPGLISHKVKGSTEIPFGPYLIAATYLVLLLSHVACAII